MQGRHDGIKNAVNLSIDPIVPEAQDTISRAFEASVSIYVAHCFLSEGVLPAIDLNDEFGTAAFEVHHVWRDGGLPSEMVAEWP